MNGTTHFGYQTVKKEEKAERVAEVFHSVAGKYDVMNDLMSLGVHRLWKRFAIDLLHLSSGERVLDLAGGTGDLSVLMAKKVGQTGQVVLSDINPSMLEEGRRRLIDKGIVGNINYPTIEFQLVDAQQIPFADSTFDAVTIGFGLRNVTDQLAALKEIRRVLRPGGRALILEFSKPVVPGLAPIYDAYSFNLLPFIGKIVANDASSYQYLAESIRMHPDQETLKSLMQQAGLERVDYHNLTGGIVAIHRGYVF